MPKTNRKRRGGKVGLFCAHTKNLVLPASEVVMHGIWQVCKGLTWYVMFTEGLTGLVLLSSDVEVGCISLLPLHTALNCL